MSRSELLDSARHKLRLAHYHAETLLNILAQHPPDVEDHPLRIALEAHLEGLAYTGTAAAEKTIRSLDPEGIRGQAAIHEMIRSARSRDSAAEQAFARRFENWWTGRERGTRYGEVARDLRNEASHDVYYKAPDGPRWRMRIGRREPVALDDFANGYRRELDDLEVLVGQAEELAAAIVRR